MTPRIPETSLEFVEFQVTSDDNPTGNIVEVAALSTANSTEYGEPVETDWVTAAWVTRNGKHYVQALVGPTSTLELDAGDYWLWTRITADPERPVRNVGLVIIT